MWAVMCVCRHVCHTQARSCLSAGWALNRCFAWGFGTAAVLAQGGGAGYKRKGRFGPFLVHKLWVPEPPSPFLLSSETCLVRGGKQVYVPKICLKFRFSLGQHFLTWVVGSAGCQLGAPMLHPPTPGQGLSVLQLWSLVLMDCRGCIPCRRRLWSFWGRGRRGGRSDMPNPRRMSARLR